jgi:hypothetical protein
MILTRENYHSLEANKEYMGVSQLKTFIDCQARGLAEVKGEYVRDGSNVALLVGSYVDAHFSKGLDLFKAQNPEIFTQKGVLKSDYKKANGIIARIEQDKLFMEHMDGELQAIRTGEINGVKFKVMADVLHPNKIVDLKIVKDFKGQYKDGLYMNFIEFWGYDIQAAIYQEIISNMLGLGNKLPFIIGAATKEPTTNIALLSVPQQRMDYCLDLVKNLLEDIMLVKNGLQEPIRCGKCDYCKQTKKLTEVVPYDEFFGNN